MICFLFFSVVVVLLLPVLLLLAIKVLKNSVGHDYDCSFFPPQAIIIVVTVAFVQVSWTLDDWM